MFDYEETSLRIRSPIEGIFRMVSRVMYNHTVVHVDLWTWIYMIGSVSTMIGCIMLFVRLALSSFLKRDPLDAHAKQTLVYSLFLFCEVVASPFYHLAEEQDDSDLHLLCACIDFYFVLVETCFISCMAWHVHSIFMREEGEANRVDERSIRNEIILSLTLPLLGTFIHFCFISKVSISLIFIICIRLACLCSIGTVIRRRSLIDLTFHTKFSLGVFILRLAFLTGVITVLPHALLDIVSLIGSWPKLELFLPGLCDLWYICMGIYIGVFFACLGVPIESGTIFTPPPTDTPSNPGNDPFSKQKELRGHVAPSSGDSQERTSKDGIDLSKDDSGQGERSRKIDTQSDAATTRDFSSLTTPSSDDAVSKIASTPTVKKQFAAALNSKENDSSLSTEYPRTQINIELHNVPPATPSTSSSKGESAAKVGETSPAAKNTQDEQTTKITQSTQETRSKSTSDLDKSQTTTDTTIQTPSNRSSR